MDVSALMVSATAPMHVKNAAGTPLLDDGKPVRIHFYGPSTRQFAELETRQTERSVKRHNDNDGKLTARTAEDRRQEAVDDLVLLTDRFENLSFGEKQGEELHRAVYSAPELGFILAQGSKFVSEWGNFAGGSPTS